MSQPNKGPKTMSSQLLSMKFMQRAAASKPSSPTTPSEPLSKRQRLSNGSYNSTPSSTPRSDASVIQDTLSPEEQKRNEALEQQAASRGDTKWYLSIKQSQSPAVKTPLRIVSAGYATLDGTGSPANHLTDQEDDDSSNTTPQVSGRRNFGNFNKKLEKQQAPHPASAEFSSASGTSDDDEEGEDVSDDPTGAKAMIALSRKESNQNARAEHRAKKSLSKTEAVRLEAERMAAERRKKQVKLNSLGSVSGGGGSSASRKMAHVTCHKCGEKGHVQRDCPVRSKSTGASSS